MATNTAGGLTGLLARLPREPRRRAWLMAILVWTINIPLLIAPALLGGGITPAVMVTVGTLMIGGVLICVALYGWLRRRMGRSAEAYLRSAILGVVISAVVLGALDNLGGLIVGHIGLTPPPSLGYALARAVMNTIFVGWMFVIFTAAMVLIDFASQLRERETQLLVAEGQTAQARAAATAARLAALRYQLNPHFLFNTLNAISAAVVMVRTAEAETMLTRLASFLRVTLESSAEAFVRLEDELGTVEAYLEIEAERFRERLVTTIDCPPNLRGAIVPGFILQPLVENAMKHGVARSTDPVTVAIAVTQVGDSLVIRVADDARPSHGAKPAVSGGVGLSAIRERLEVLYGARGGLSGEPRDPGFEAILRLPLSVTV